jgi:excisionase family DNA binding protein
MPEPEKQWFNPSEAAAYLGISRATLYKLMDKGKLPFVGVLGIQKRRIRKADLDLLLSPSVPRNAVKKEKRKARKPH